MKPLYSARVIDLSAKDLVQVECLGCRHLRLFTANMLATADVKPDALINKLERRLRCRHCDQRGKVILTIVWHDAPTRPSVGIVGG
jgi:hypothetical protein